jgi:hypothetical protein
METKERENCRKIIYKVNVEDGIAVKLYDDKEK